jgi:hypothetical protein
VSKSPEGRRTSRWEPLLVRTWTLNLPCQTIQVWDAKAHSKEYQHCASTRCSSMEAPSRRTSPGAPGDVSGPLSVALIGTTSSTAQVEKVVPSGQTHNKTPVNLSGVINALIRGPDSRQVRQEARGPDEKEIS